MNGRAVRDVSGLPDIAFTMPSPLFWGAMGIMMIEGTMFLLLVASYFYSRLGVDVWPPPGTQLRHVTMATVEVLVLLLSVVPAYFATEAAKRDDTAKTRLHMILNGLLAVAALGLRAVEWSWLNFNWHANIEASMVWMILTLHTFEVVSAVVFTIVLVVITFTPRWSATQRKAVDFDSLTWYFLVGIWIPLYATIFLAPYLVQHS